MIDYLRRPVAHEAFFKKYASKKFLKGIISYLRDPLVLANYITSLNSDTSMGQEVSPSIP